MLELKHVRLERKGRIILDDVNLIVHSGEVHGILGQNGTGKSSLAYLVMGLPEYLPDSGTVLFDKKDITHSSITERALAGITLAWQEPIRFEGITVRDYLELAGSCRESHSSASECLTLVGLDAARYLSRPVDRTLSGGERKRIELASVLAMQPRLAVLDEPDSGIDSLSIEAIKQVIRTLSRHGSSVLLITHHEAVSQMVDRASAMCAGKILETGDPARITRFFQNHCSGCDHVNLTDPDMEASLLGNVAK